MHRELLVSSGASLWRCFALSRKCRPFRGLERKDPVSRPGILEGSCGRPRISRRVSARRFFNIRIWERERSGLSLEGAGDLGDCRSGLIASIMFWNEGLRSLRAAISSGSFRLGNSDWAWRFFFACRLFACWTHIHVCEWRQIDAASTPRPARDA